MRKSATLAVLAVAALAVGIAATGCSRTPTPSSASSSSPSVFGITPSPATDWTQTKTYVDKHFGFSFDYDAARFAIKVAQTPLGAVLFVYLKDANGAASLDEFQLSKPIAKPSFLHGAKPSKRQLALLIKHFFGAGQPAGSSFLSKPHLVVINGLVGIAGDGLVPEADSPSQMLRGRFYVLCGKRALYELGVVGPRQSWPIAWATYQGIVASFRSN
jgi:hypothetical protein